MKRLCTICAHGGSDRILDVAGEWGPDKAIGDETLLYVMPRGRSADINTKLDFRIAEMLLADQEPR